MNARSYLAYREQRLSNARAEIRSVYRTGGMSDRELYDMANFLAAQCAPEQAAVKDQLLSIAMDLEPIEPDADAFRRYPGPQTLDSRLERV